MSYEQFAKPAPDADSLAQLSALADELDAKKLELAEIQDQLSRATEAVKSLEERQIPELMDLIGIKSFVTTSGVRIDVDEKLSASIPKDRFSEAIEWLEDNGHSGIIKSQIFALFDRGEVEVANELIRELKDRGFSAGEKYDVHPQTLAKLFRDLDKSGVDFPEDVFGIYRRRVAKLTRK